jgi:hypothetical protein
MLGQRCAKSSYGSYLLTLHHSIANKPRAHAV